MGLLAAFLGTQKRVQFIRNDKTVIQIDATMSETHGRTSTASKFPIEDGSSIGDHFILGNHTLKLQGIISDTPIRLEQALLTTAISAFVPPLGVVAVAAGANLVQRLFSSTPKSPSVQAYEQLLDLQAQRQPFSVVTTLKRYDKMWITNLSAPRDSATGQALVFDLELEQVILVTPLTIRLQIFKNSDLSADKALLGKQDKNNALVEQFKKGQAAFHTSAGA